ncbi:hypothetical protein [Reichenbachiella agariperforans]|uniref:hypothetical protein n=1 Tax=Reichenbachiella agariperforans TaxID=156994 RepID=UPI001C09EABE|nr:hypothetical protein [Reichenbachiella agariperforans]MBU2913456.1 hypothetical protein [Reichenbachiella agariperforans]
MKKQPNKDPLENAFRERVSLYEATPPLNGWTDISSIMDKEKRKRGTIYGIVASLIFLFGLTSILFYTKKGTIPLQESTDKLSARTTTNTNAYNTLDSSNQKEQNHDNTEFSSQSPKKTLLETNKKEHSTSTYLSKTKFSRIDESSSSPVTALSTTSNSTSPSHSLNSKNKSQIQLSTENSIITNPNTDLQEMQELDRLIPKTIVFHLDSMTSTIPDTIPIENHCEYVNNSKNSKRTINYDKWSLKISTGVNYSFKKISPQIDEFFINTLDNKNQFSLNNSGYQFSGQIRRELIKHLGVYGGIGFNHQREYTQYSFYEIIPETYEITSLNAMSFEVKPNLVVQENTFESKYNTINYSLGLSYSLKKQQSIYAGFSYSNILKGTVVSSDSSQQLLYKSNLVTADLSWENTLPLKNKWCLIYSINMSYALTSIYSESSIYNSQPIIFSLNLGLLKLFK